MDLTFPIFQFYPFVEFTHSSLIFRNRLFSGCFTLWHKPPFLSLSSTKLKQIAEMECHEAAAADTPANTPANTPPPNPEHSQIPPPPPPEFLKIHDTVEKINLRCDVVMMKYKRFKASMQSRWVVWIFGPDGFTSASIGLYGNFCRSLRVCLSVTRQSVRTMKSMW